MTTTFDDYRAADSLVVPFTFAETSENGRWSARVVGVETPSAVSDRAFAPPPAPADSSLAGTTSLPMLGPLQQPVIEVRVDDGPPLHVVLDTGGQNVLTPDAARRSGLAVVGSGTVGGAGAGLVPVRYATARRVRVGMAEMRGQPFLVLDLGAGFPVDGIVGYELLARFAARVDFAHKRVDLAPRAAAFGNAGTVVPFVFEERMPQADGAIDGVPAALTIDTGSTSALDVNAPFVRAHALVQRYSAVPVGTSIYGVGGGVRASVGRAKVLRLGSVRVPNVRLLLTDASAGFESNPSVAGNVGDEVLRRFVIVFDYRAMTMRFVPVGALTATRTSPARVQALPVGSLRKPGRRVATGGRRTRP
ncbi:MAG: aspartyl protease family protein [Candidatus Eremiobacteraeota bacterium]|nr:aspartyl protease family protein [Candidatus Eremiobacteraeota bacterium]